MVGFIFCYFFSAMYDVVPLLSPHHHTVMDVLRISQIQGMFLKIDANDGYQLLAQSRDCPCKRKVKLVEGKKN